MQLDSTCGIDYNMDRTDWKKALCDWRITKSRFALLTIWKGKSLNMQLPAKVHEWWKALQKQVATDENGAGFLCIYEPDGRRLSPALPQNTGFADIPANAVAETYEAGKKGFLGDLRPGDLALCAGAAAPAWSGNFARMTTFCAVPFLSVRLSAWSTR